MALVIVALGMAALLSSINSSADTVNYLREKTFAEWVALDQIATQRLRLVAPNQLPPEGTTTGDVDFAGRSWHWRQEVVKTMVDGMMRIDVKVRPGEFKGDEDAGWITTVSGLVGNAVAPPMIPAETYGTVDAGSTNNVLGGNRGGLGGNNAPMIPTPVPPAQGSTSSSLSGSGGADESSTTQPQPPPDPEPNP